MQNDYYAYFEGIWQKTKFLKSFRDLEIDEVLGDVRSKISHNDYGLLLEPCLLEDKKEGDVFISELNGAFTILRNVRLNDTADRLDVLQKSFDYCKEIVCQISEDIACCGVFCGANLAGLQYSKQGAIFDNAYGTRCEFILRKTTIYEKNKELWQ